MKKVRITLSQAVAGFILSIEGRRLSHNTINDYSNTLRKIQASLGNPYIDEITSEDISRFILAQPVSKKTASNYHACLSSMWAWLLREKLVDENIINVVDRPKPEKRAIVPLEEHEIRALLSCLEKSRIYSRPGKRTSSHTAPQADRNRAIILFLLDNGVRVSELCSIKISHLDRKNSRCYIMGKGAKERYVPFSSRTGQALWKYLTIRGEYDPDDYLFVTDEGRQLNRNRVLHILYNIGARAGVENVHPHRFRHTFAINYLRAGGDIFTLQAILGHEDLDMVRHYARIANYDVAVAHRRASPVEFMRL